MFRWLVFIITLCSLIIRIHAQAQNEIGSNPSDGNDHPSSAHIGDSPIPAHNDTSRDKEGEDHDSEPFRNNGRGTHEANSQNHAAETNGTHGIPIDQFQQIFLDQHNAYRRQMCANDLQNDNDLHEMAQKLANAKANGNDIPSSDEFNVNFYDLDTGDPSKITGEMIVKSWYDKHNQYKVNDESSAPEFSQLVWKSSNRLGVGHAYSGHKLFVYALYKPPGNIRGQFSMNVGCGSNGR